VRDGGPNGIIVVDISDLDEEARAENLNLAETLSTRLSSLASCRIFYLGCSAALSGPAPGFAGARGGVLEHYRPVRLLGPILELHDPGDFAFVLVLARGEILDLADLVNSEWTDKTVIAYAAEGGHPMPDLLFLRRPSGEQLEMVARELVRRTRRGGGPERPGLYEPPIEQPSAGTMQIRLDKTNYPLIWVEGIQAHLHVLPVTKVQFEQYLVDPKAIYDGRFYLEAVSLNPRTSPIGLTGDNYWQAFVTGVTVEECSGFASWLGAGYGLPDIDEWKEAYRFLSSLRADALYSELVSSGVGLAKPARITLERITQELSPTSAADLCLLNNAIAEWARTADGKSPWQGVGTPNPRFSPRLVDPERSQPVRPLESSSRIRDLGFRLRLRGAT
jgi:hypothetical protein